MEGSALHCVLVPVIYHSDTRLKRLKGTSVAECAIHFCKKGLPGGEMLGHVDIMGVLAVASAHTGYLVSKESRNSVDEVVFGDKLTENGRRRMLGP